MEPTWITDLREQHDALKDSATNLSEFFISRSPHAVGPKQLKLLRQQLSLTRQLLLVLGNRLIEYDSNNVVETTATDETVADETADADAFLLTKEDEVPSEFDNSGDDDEVSL